MLGGRNACNTYILHAIYGLSMWNTRCIRPQSSWHMALLLDQHIIHFGNGSHYHSAIIFREIFCHTARISRIEVDAFEFYDAIRLAAVVGLHCVEHRADSISFQFALPFTTRAGYVACNDSVCMSLAMMSRAILTAISNYERQDHQANELWLRH